MGWVVGSLNRDRDKRFPLLKNCPDRLWDPSSLLLIEYLYLFLVVKWQGYDVDHSPLT
jgi:hypothetical protein